MIVHWLEQRAADVPADSGWLSPLECAHLDGLRFAKRRADWRLGRWTAKHALAKCLDLDSGSLAGIEIRPAVSGAPEVSRQIDRSGFLYGFVTAMAWRHAWSHLRAPCCCDLEVLEPRSHAFLADYFAAPEQQLIGTSPGADRDKVLNLFWSAKESTLKALGVGLREDSRCVIVGPIDGLSWPNQLSDADRRPFAGGPAAGRWNPMQVIYTRGRIFHGWWQQEGSLLRTLVAFRHQTARCPGLGCFPLLTFAKARNRKVAALTLVSRSYGVGLPKPLPHPN